MNNVNQADVPWERPLSSSRPSTNLYGPNTSSTHVSITRRLTNRDLRRRPPRPPKRPRCKCKMLHDCRPSALQRQKFGLTLQHLIRHLRRMCRTGECSSEHFDSNIVSYAAWLGQPIATPPVGRHENKVAIYGRCLPWGGRAKNICYDGSCARRRAQGTGSSRRCVRNRSLPRYVNGMHPSSKDFDARCWFLVIRRHIPGNSSRAMTQYSAKRRV